MTKDELRDKSYRVASSAFLIEELTFEQYDIITEEGLEALLWEPVEKLGASEVLFLIESLAAQIETAFEECVT